MDYWLLNGFLLPTMAYSALCELTRLGRFQDLDSAIREGIRTVLEKNASLLVGSDPKWIRSLGHMERAFRDPRRVSPDRAGAWNLRFLQKMYAAIAKFETKLNQT